ncbi:MAG TPA: CvpA family protein [Chitinophagaceae bacterium]
MAIDILFAILLLVAVIHGYRRGLIVAVFSTLAIFIGLAAALKLSAVVAGYLDHSVNISSRWLPVLSFVIVFVGVLLLVRLGAKALQRVTETLMLGWLNRIGGVVLYALIYMMVFSICLFYATELGLIKAQTIADSKTYHLVEPWGRKAIDFFGSLVPVFRNMFAQLEEFFSRLSKKAATG